MLATLSHDGELAARRFVLTVDLRIAVMCIVGPVRLIQHLQQQRCSGYLVSAFCRAGSVECYRSPCVILSLGRFRMNCKYSHTTTTRSAPGQNVNSRKMKAMNKIIELIKPMLNTLLRGIMR